MLLTKKYINGWINNKPYKKKKCILNGAVQKDNSCSLTAWGKELLCNPVLRQQILLYHLPGGSRISRLRLGWVILHHILRFTLYPVISYHILFYSVLYSNLSGPLPSYLTLLVLSCSVLQYFPSLYDASFSIIRNITIYYAFIHWVQCVPRIGSVHEIWCISFQWLCMSPDGMYLKYTAYLCLRSATFACSMAVLAEIQCYTITYLIKHYHAQQDRGALRRVEV